MSEHNRSHLAVSISAGPIIDGMGNEDPTGSYVRINFDGRRYKISKGMAENLIAELSGSLRVPPPGVETEGVEAAAVAIFRCHNGESAKWGYASPAVQAGCRRFAEAALSARALLSMSSRGGDSQRPKGRLQ